ELLERAVDEARLENVLGRRCDRQIAELHVEVGGELLDRRIEPPFTPQTFSPLRSRTTAVRNARSRSPSRSCRISPASPAIAIIYPVPPTPIPDTLFNTS